MHAPVFAELSAVTTRVRIANEANMNRHYAGYMSCQCASPSASS